MDKHPTYPRLVTLLCPEPLRPMACCVEDALVARGWAVRLETGPRARHLLAGTIEDGDLGLRVVCVEEELDDDVVQRLHRRLDPQGRGDLRVVTFRTPRDVIDAVGSSDPFYPQRRVPERPYVRRARARRTYLAHPTLVEQPIDRGRAIGYGLGGAAAGLAIAVGLVLVTGDAEGHPPLQRLESMSEVSEQAPAQPRPRPFADDTVFSSAARNIDAELPEPPPIPRQPVSAPEPTLSPTPEQPEDIEVIEVIEVIEDATGIEADDAIDAVAQTEPDFDLGELALLEPAPLEEGASTAVAARPDPVGVPGIRRSGAPDTSLRGLPTTLDPFADLDDDG